MQQQTAYIIVSWCYVAGTLALVINRLLVRGLRRGTWGGRGQWSSTISDTLVVIAWILNVLQCVLQIVIYKNGALVSRDELATEDLSSKELDGLQVGAEVYYVGGINYYLPLYAIKGAILCFLLEVTPENLVHIRRAIWVGIGLSVVGLIFNEICFIYTCGIPSWTYSTAPSGCVASANLYIAALTMHMFTDIYIYIIPFFLIQNIKAVSRSQKIATGIMFGAGFILVCFSIPQLLSGIIPALFNPIMWDFWVSIHEQSFAVVVACLPALRVTLQGWFGPGARAWGGTGRRGSSLIKRLRRGELDTREVVGSSSNATSKSAGTVSVGDSTLVGSPGVTVPSRPAIVYRDDNV